MSYDVLPEELRTAATSFVGVADDLGAESPLEPQTTPTGVGHVELAAWLVAVAEQCDNAHQALHQGATDLATNLRATADDFEQTDTGVGGLFTPFGLSSPAAPPAPLYGPFVPGSQP